jgi:hypothetical protein
MSEQEPTTKVIAATKTSLISIVIVAQASTKNHTLPLVGRNALCMQPTRRHGRGQDLQGDIPKKEKRH